MLPDIFLLGIALERLAAKLSGAGPDYDTHQVRDMDFHLDTFREHSEGARAASTRGDPYNVLVEASDAAINAFFAWVASRIIDSDTRAQAFRDLNEGLRRA